MRALQASPGISGASNSGQLCLHPIERGNQMANRREFQFLYSKQPKLTLRTGLITFGGSGSVAAYSGPALGTVSKLTTGIYQIKFVDNFYAYIGAKFCMLSGTSGAAVGDGTLTANTLYQIVTVGNTPWTTIGFDSDYTPVVGAPFVASGTGASGTNTGVAKAIATAGSGIYAVEVVENQSKLLTNLNPNAPRGSSIIVQTLGPTGGTASSSTTLLPASPAAGSQMSFKVFFRDSSAPTS